MEKEKYFLNSSSPPSLNYGASSSSPPTMGELNCSSEQQLPNCFLNLNWENSMDQNLPFESALSSIVSSPVASNSSIPTENVVIRELIGRLGSICNSGEISPQSQTFMSNGNNNNSTNTSCYTTPLNSPPKLNLSMMDHQIRGGNLPIQGNSMTTHHPTLAPFPSDPGFAERAARYSSFTSRNFGGGLSTQFGLNEPELPYRSSPRVENGKLSRVSSSQSLKASGSQMGNQENKDFPIHHHDTMLDTEMRSVLGSDRRFHRLSRTSSPEKGEFNNAHENSSISEQIPIMENGLIKVTNDVNSRKRKATPKGKAKELVVPSNKMVEEDESKRSKSSDASGNEKETVKTKGESKNNKEAQKPPEPPKDYIHVRARRGQATDSHSLAERVRREKISERMKFLQDLVPGCNKVTGKAVMLDEIINYVQSLQKQVEFLSMKLSTVNPRLDFNMETLLSKDMIQSRGSYPNSIYPLDSSASTFPYGSQPHHQQGPNIQNGIPNGIENHCSVNQLDASAFRRNLGIQLPTLDGFCESAAQLGSFWEDDLQSVVQMGFGQNQAQEPTFQSHNSHGLPTTNMKVEL